MLPPAVLWRGGSVLRRRCHCNADILQASCSDKLHKFESKPGIEFLLIFLLTTPATGSPGVLRSPPQGKRASPDLASLLPQVHSDIVNLASLTPQVHSGIVDLTSLTRQMYSCIGDLISLTPQVHSESLDLASRSTDLASPFLEPRPAQGGVAWQPFPLREGPVPLTCCLSWGEQGRVHFYQPK